MTPSFPTASDTPPTGNFGALEMGPLVNIDQDTRLSMVRNRSDAQLSVATPNLRHALLTYWPALCETLHTL
jgi:hypothetical protein